MSFKNLVLTVGAALGVSLAASAASATTYDALAYFTPASAVSGPFQFGSTSGGVFTQFPTGGACLLQNTVCLTSGNYLGVYKSIDGAAHPGSGTVDVPGNALILHPGSAGEIATILFTAPTTGLYNLSANFFQATNTNANSVNLYNFFGGQSLFATLTAASPTYSGSLSNFTLHAGDVVGVGVEYAGNYQFDSTGVNFTLTAVPEPATWGFMVLGFGVAGVSMRRRTAARAAA